MRHAISWADLRGETVGVWGLGVEGEANVRLLRELGATITLVDDSLADYQGTPVLHSERGGLDALARCAVVVKSPGVPRHDRGVRTLESSGVPVVGGTGLWLQGAPRDRVIAVTGTKGKSTTVSMIGHLLNRLGRPASVCGNIGQPPYDPARTGPEPDLWVLEVSSYQATDVAVSPPIVAVTSLHPDHLDWHGSIEQYYADKLSLCSQPGAERTIANRSSPALVERASQLGPTIEWVAPDGARRTSWHRSFGVRGDHNLDNAEIAARCIRALGIDAADGDLAVAASAFPGLAHRLQTVAVVDGVEFVDDSLSTNVLPTLRAIEAFDDRRTVVIVGGYDRGIDYHALGHGLAARQTPLLVVTIPDSGPRIQRELAQTPLPNAVEVAAAVDLDDAVRVGASWAQPDGVVLLSPAAPSFGVYRDYRARAAGFLDAIASVAAQER